MPSRWFGVMIITLTDFCTYSKHTCQMDISYRSRGLWFPWKPIFGISRYLLTRLTKERHISHCHFFPPAFITFTPPAYVITQDAWFEYLHVIILIYKVLVCIFSCLHRVHRRSMVWIFTCDHTSSGLSASYSQEIHGLNISNSHLVLFFLSPPTSCVLVLATDHSWVLCLQSVCIMGAGENFFF